MNSFSEEDCIMGMVTTLDGKTLAVIHEYDRHKDLVDFVDNMYREKNS